LIACLLDNAFAVLPPFVYCCRSDSGQIVFSSKVWSERQELENGGGRSYASLQQKRKHGRSLSSFFTYL
jgi:hypothetical protein